MVLRPMPRQRRLDTPPAGVRQRARDQDALEAIG